MWNNKWWEYEDKLSSLAYKMSELEDTKVSTYSFVVDEYMNAARDCLEHNDFNCVEYNIAKIKEILGE